MKQYQHLFKQTPVHKRETIEPVADNDPTGNPVPQSTINKVREIIGRTKERIEGEE